MYPLVCDFITRGPGDRSTMARSSHEIVQPIASGTDESSPAHDHVTRHASHQVSKPSLASERLHEMLSLERRQHMCGDPPGQVNTARSQHLERKIAGLIAENRNKSVQRG